MKKLHDLIAAIGGNLQSLTLLLVRRLKFGVAGACTDRAAAGPYL